MLTSSPTPARRLLHLVALLVGLSVLSLTWVPASHAAPNIVFDASPWDGPPPPTLGPYTMTPFAHEPALNAFVTSVNGPTGTVDFGQEIFQTVVDDHWSGWGHGYLGNVYYAPQTTHNRVVITLPPNTGAVYFYVMAIDDYPTSLVEITANSNVSAGPLAINRYQARYVGFYATGGATLETITLEMPLYQGFGLGEFAIALGRPEHSVRFHQPLDPSTHAGIVTNKAKAGRTIPVKLEIGLDGIEQDARTLASPPTIAVSEIGCTAQASDAVESYGDSGATTSGTAFRWSDDAPGLWIYNLDTKTSGMTAGHCYRLDVYIGSMRITTDTTEWAMIEITK